MTTKGMRAKRKFVVLMSFLIVVAISTGSVVGSVAILGNLASYENKLLQFVAMLPLVSDTIPEEKRARAILQIGLDQLELMGQSDKFPETAFQYSGEMEAKATNIEYAGTVVLGASYDGQHEGIDWRMNGAANADIGGIETTVIANGVVTDENVYFKTDSAFFGPRSFDAISGGASEDQWYKAGLEDVDIEFDTDQFFQTANDMLTQEEAKYIGMEEIMGEDAYHFEFDLIGMFDTYRSDLEGEGIENIENAKLGVWVSDRNGPIRFELTISGVAEDDVTFEGRASLVIWDIGVDQDIWIPTNAEEL